MTRRYTIKQLPPELRPRERLLAAGPGALSDGELLGLLFGIGNREKTAVELAGEVISEAGSLHGLYDVSVHDSIDKRVRDRVPGPIDGEWHTAGRIS